MSQRQTCSILSRELCLMLRNQTTLSRGADLYTTGEYPPKFRLGTAMTVSPTVCGYMWDRKFLHIILTSVFSNIFPRLVRLRVVNTFVDHSQCSIRPTFLEQIVQKSANISSADLLSTDIVGHRKSATCHRLRNSG